MIADNGDVGAIHVILAVSNSIDPGPGERTPLAAWQIGWKRDRPGVVS